MTSVQEKEILKEKEMKGANPKTEIKGLRMKRAAQQRKITLILKKLSQLQLEIKLTPISSKLVEDVDNMMKLIDNYDQQISSIMNVYEMYSSDLEYYESELDSQGQYNIDISVELDQFREIGAFSIETSEGE